MIILHTQLPSKHSQHAHTRCHFPCTYFEGLNHNWQCLQDVVENKLTIHYTWGLRYLDDLVCRHVGLDKIYSLADPNWNVVALTDSTATPLERYTYTAFGTCQIHTPTFTPRPTTSYHWTRTFTSQLLDPETGLLLYRNRFYHPTLGRFLTRDPIGYAGMDANLYRYVGNQTLIKVDLLGVKECMISIFIGHNNRNPEERSDLMKDFMDNYLNKPDTFVGFITCWSATIPVDECQKIPGFLTREDEQPFSSVKAWAKYSKKRAKELQKKLCDNYFNKRCKKGAQQEGSGSEFPDCESVSISFVCDADAIKQLQKVNNRSPAFSDCHKSRIYDCTKKVQNAKRNKRCCP